MPPDRRGERQAALRVALEGEGLDGLLVTHLPNIRYLTGFSGSAALLLVRPDSTTLVTDFRYGVQAPAEAGEAAVVEIDQTSVWDRLGRLLGATPAGSLGIESQAITVRDAERVSGLTRSRVVPTSDLVERLRAVKSPEEVAAIRAAADLAQEALAEVLPSVRPGRTEAEIAAALEAALRRRGSEWPNASAKPRAAITSRASASPSRPVIPGRRCSSARCWALRTSSYIERWRSSARAPTTTVRVRSAQ